MVVAFMAIERYTGLTKPYNEARTLREQKENEKKATRTRMIAGEKKLLRKFRKS